MRLYEREIDTQDGRLVRESILQLVPPVTWQEIAALHKLSEKDIWRERLDSLLIGVWELEQLDRRGWIEAQDIDLEPDERGGLTYVSRGPWYRPSPHRLGSGRPEWPTIHDGLRHATNPPKGRLFRLWAQIRLTPRGLRVSELVSMNEAPDLGVFDGTAYELQRVIAGWRQGDRELSRCLEAGFSTAQSGFEHIIRDQARACVRGSVGRLKLELVPKLNAKLDPGLRDELRALVRDLDPDTAAVDEMGHETQRWRLAWPQLGCEERIHELIPLLWEMEPRPEIMTPHGGHIPGPEHPLSTYISAQQIDTMAETRPLDSDKATSWTVNRLCKEIARSQTTLTNWRNRAIPPVPGRKKNQRFACAELARLGDAAIAAGDPEAAAKIRRLLQ